MPYAPPPVKTRHRGTSLLLYTNAHNDANPSRVSRLVKQGMERVFEQIHYLAPSYMIEHVNKLATSNRASPTVSLHSHGYGNQRQQIRYPPNHFVYASHEQDQDISKSCNAQIDDMVEAYHESSRDEVGGHTVIPSPTGHPIPWSRTRKLHMFALSWEGSTHWMLLWQLVTPQDGDTWPSDQSCFLGLERVP